MPQCDKCGKEANIRFAVCSEKHCEECYGPVDKMDTFNQGPMMQPAIFDEYYDRALQQNCVSYRDQERKVKEFNERQRNLPPDQRDPCHPDGFSFANDDHKLMAECKRDSKHKEELREAQFEGYRGRQRHRYNPNDPDRGKSRRIYSFGSGR